MSKTLSYPIAFLALIIFSISSCKKSSSDDAGSVNCLGVDVFSLSDDIKLGYQTDSQIRATPAQFKILPETDTAYYYLNKIRDNILNSKDSNGHFKVVHKDDFPWKVTIIQDDTTLNAFCTPGGYIFVYTGIIKYLDTEDQLAGVLGHEMGHADNRHSTKALTASTGFQTLQDYLLGKSPNSLVTIVDQLTSLKYSRCQEAQADEYSVIYLSGTNYKCNGAADFFIKLQQKGQGQQIPVFLSDHPGDVSRITAINTKAKAIHCDTTYRVSSADYTAFKASLP